MIIEWDVAIPMDDGANLRADVFRPDGAGRWPVILSHGPYGKGLAFQEGRAREWEELVAGHPEVLTGSSNRYQCWEVADPERWVPDGYVCVRVDSRGAGRSPGYLDPLSERETRDLYACIEWAGAAPWSNGRVGLLGISYYAINQWQVAALAPPHLTAICPWEGGADFYRDLSRHGGVLSRFWESWYERRVLPVQHGVGERGYRSAVTGEWVAGPETLSEMELAGRRADIAGMFRQHVLDDEYYRDRTPRLDQITVPLLSAANWGGQGLHSRGNFEGFLRSASPAKWLEVHGGSHWESFYSADGLALQKQFFDRFLKGERNGFGKDWRVRLQVRSPDGFRVRLEHQWPPARGCSHTVVPRPARAPPFHGRACSGGSGSLRGTRARHHLSRRPTGLAARDHRAAGLLPASIDHGQGRRPVRGAPPFRPAAARGRLSRCAGPACTPRTGMAPALAASSR